MKHFNGNDWIRFSRNQTEENIAEEMENHLLECSSCMESYLSAIDAIDLGTSVSPTFAEDIMQEISKINKQKTEKPKLNKLFVYYTIAACLTLLLTFSGAFQYLSGSFPHTSTQLANSHDGIKSMFENGWTERLTNKTVILLGELKPKEN